MFGGTITDYSVAGVAAKHLDAADLILTGGHGLALIAHKNIRFANVAIDMLPESGNVGLFTLKGTVKGTDLTVQGVEDGKIAAHAIDRFLRGAK